MKLRGLRDKVGKDALIGVRTTKLARRYEVSTDTVVKCAEEFLRSMEGYDTGRHVELLRIPGNGKLRAAKAYYLELIRA